jgi:thimet oligopeptidase
MKKQSLLFLLLAAIAFSGNTPPEVHPPVTQQNPLMPQWNELYDFQRVTEAQINSAAMYSENNVIMLTSVVSGIDSTRRTFENTMLVIDDIFNVLQKQQSVYELLVNTHADKKIRDLTGQKLEHFTSLIDQLYLNEQLYRSVREYSASAEAKALTGERKFFLDKITRDFLRNGMKLPLADREQLKKLNQELNELGVSFAKNISTNKDKVIVMSSETAGLTEEFLKPFRKGADTVMFDLSSPTYTTVMSQCKNTETRRKMYMAKMNVGGAANEEILSKILAKRTEKAKLLGYKTYAEFATGDIMSGNPARVWEFEKTLAEDLLPKAEADLNKLLALKAAETGNKEVTIIFPYEAMYYQTRLLEKDFNVDPEKVKEYFPMQACIDGIFSVYQKIYDLRFVKDERANTWHKEVLAYSVYDNKKNERIGYFYLDLYPRADKYNHFGCFGLTGSKTFANGNRQLRTAALVCNFPVATPDKPSLLPHTMVTTFFHEFGHLMHVILSETELAAFAGTNVAIDFVEAPSQIMENWAWDEKVLALFAKHYKTGAPIPADLITRMISARTANSGLNTLQQVYYGTLDFQLNDNPEPLDAAGIYKLNAELQNRITLYPWVEGTHFAGGFGHLNGYGSKYYGYLWSLVYACDMYSAFAGKGALSPEMGQRYRREVLSKGGSNDALQLVSNFLGREPDNKAFLRYLGLEKK